MRNPLSLLVVSAFVLSAGSLQASATQVSPDAVVGLIGKDGLQESHQSMLREAARELARESVHDYEQLVKLLQDSNKGAATKAEVRVKLLSIRRRDRLVLGLREIVRKGSSGSASPVSVNPVPVDAAVREFVEKQYHARKAEERDQIAAVLSGVKALDRGAYDEVLKKAESQGPAGAQGFLDAVKKNGNDVAKAAGEVRRSVPAGAEPNWLSRNVATPVANALSSLFGSSKEGSSPAASAGGAGGGAGSSDAAVPTVSATRDVTPKGDKAESDKDPVNILTRLLKDDAAKREVAVEAIHKFLWEDHAGASFIDPALRVEEASSKAMRAVIAKSAELKPDIAARILFCVGVGSETEPAWAAEAKVSLKGYSKESTPCKTLLVGALLKQEKLSDNWVVGAPQPPLTAATKPQSDWYAGLAEKAKNAVDEIRRVGGLARARGLVADQGRRDERRGVTVSGPGRSFGGAARAYSAKDLFGEWGHEDVVGIKYPNGTGRTLSLRIITEVGPDSRAVDKLGVYDITNPAAPFGRSFDLNYNEEKPFALKAGGHEFKLKLVQTADGDITISLEGADGEKAFNQAGEKLPTIDRLYQRRVERATDEVEIGGARYRVTAQSAYDPTTKQGRGAFVYFPVDVDPRAPNPRSSLRPRFLAYVNTRNGVNDVTVGGKTPLYDLEGKQHRANEKYMALGYNLEKQVWETFAEDKPTPAPDYVRPAPEPKPTAGGGNGQQGGGNGAKPGGAGSGPRPSAPQGYVAAEGLNKKLGEGSGTAIYVADPNNKAVPIPANEKYVVAQGNRALKVPSVVDVIEGGIVVTEQATGTVYYDAQNALANVGSVSSSGVFSGILSEAVLRDVLQKAGFSQDDIEKAFGVIATLRAQGLAKDFDFAKAHPGYGEGKATGGIAPGAALKFNGVGIVKDKTLYAGANDADMVQLLPKLKQNPTLAKNAKDADAKGDGSGQAQVFDGKGRSKIELNPADRENMFPERSRTADGTDVVLVQQVGGSGARLYTLADAAKRPKQWFLKVVVNAPGQEPMSGTPGLIFEESADPKQGATARHAPPDFSKMRFSRIQIPEGAPMPKRNNVSLLPVDGSNQNAGAIGVHDAAEANAKSENRNCIGVAAWWGMSPEEALKRCEGR